MCAQGALPSGTVSVSFACGVMALAGQLGAEPRVTLEVWHKERYAAPLNVQPHAACCSGGCQQ
jgi:hypothetical protein